MEAFALAFFILLFMATYMFAMKFFAARRIPKMRPFLVPPELLPICWTGSGVV
ncbi:hypothetical protein DSM110093_03964 (plasmid) [Sulfitobacter sp. DSM 110093]|nr:hypothetical protein DSM110093_03964 [Sulfitobacter sp. DSM 110093]